MRLHSEEFKTKIKEFGRQLDSIIISSGGDKKNLAELIDIYDMLPPEEINNKYLSWNFPSAEEVIDYEKYPPENDTYEIIGIGFKNNQSPLQFIIASKNYILEELLEGQETIVVENKPEDFENSQNMYYLIAGYNDENNNIIVNFLYCFDNPNYVNEKNFFLENNNMFLRMIKSSEIQNGEFLKNYENYLYIGDESITLTNKELNAVTPVLQSGLLKSVMKELDIDSNVDIPVGTIINYKFGVLLDSGDYEYLDFGNYQVYSSEKQEDTNSYNIVAYDKMLNSMISYENLGIEYPITIREYISKICEHLQITFANDNGEFANYNQVIANELYLDNEGQPLGYTFRDILDELAQVTASNIIINDNDELEIKYITDTSDTIDEEYLKDVNVKFGEKYGPVNSIVLSRAAGADNVYLQDEQSVTDNGLCELKISDNQIMNFNDRSDYLPAILEKLDGLEFYINDFSSTGICYYEIADRYNVKVKENTYSCVMFNDEIDVTQGLEEKIYTDLPEQAETDYTKADKTDIRINQTYIIANKNTGDITALTSRTQTLEDGLANNYYTKEQTNTLVQNAETGVTNTFSEAGGNNIFRNTGLWFENDDDDREQNPYEFWQGKAIRNRNNQSATGNSILLQDGTFSQTQTVPNGNYAVSFYYQKLIPLANATVTINDVTYDLSSQDVEQFYTGKKNSQTEEYITLPINVTTRTLTIQFTTDTNDSVEVFDLMGNKGTVKLAYSQNENETTTDTVNISKGITITSSNLDVQFKANADGIRTLDNRGNVLAEFTDQGMTTKKIVVKEDSQIVDLLITKVENQTWITGV